MYIIMLIEKAIYIQYTKRFISISGNPYSNDINLIILLINYNGSDRR